MSNMIVELWKVVTDDPTDFTGWTHLISKFESRVVIVNKDCTQIYPCYSFLH